MFVRARMEYHSCMQNTIYISGCQPEGARTQDDLSEHQQAW